jgi:hypothetical protein
MNVVQSSNFTLYFILYYLAYIALHNIETTFKLINQILMID